MLERVFLVDLVNDDQLITEIQNAGFDVVDCITDLLNLRKQVKVSGGVDFVIIKTKAPSPELFKIVKDVIDGCVLPVVIFTESTTRQYTQLATSIGVGAYIVSGFEPKRIKHIMELASARFDDTKQLKSELEKIRSTLAERKIIEKAKGIIMKRKTIDEESAFKLMRKMAMDKNQKISEVAKSIINVDSMFTN